jgi:outer membrane lipoprotein-sorting protein
MKRAGWVMAVGLAVGASHGAAWGLSASYDQRVTTGGDIVESAVRIKDGQMRIESIADGERIIVFKNPQGYFSYLPDEGFAMRLSDAERAYQPIAQVEDYASFLQEQQATVIGSETVNGYACDIYQYADPQGEGSVTAWVWRERQFPVKVELGGLEGTTVAELTNIQLDIPLAESEFALPDGVEVLDAESLGGGVGLGMDAEDLDLQQLMDGGYGDE